MSIVTRVRTLPYALAVVYSTLMFQPSLCAWASKRVYCIVLLSHPTGDSCCLLLEVCCPGGVWWEGGGVFVVLVLSQS